jgi:triphosphoribosyl-dephospho-CoA synthase
MNIESHHLKHLQKSIQTACVLEATARKPGNVHPWAAFEDLKYDDFLRSANVIAPVLARSQEQGVGRTILTAIEKTHSENRGNVNLGIVLLITPLAAVPIGVPVAEGIHDVLAGLTKEDASLAYRAIQLAHPGGMGEVAEEDLSEEPTVTLLETMRLAAERDTIASEYANGFDLVLNVGVPILEATADFAGEWENAIIGLQLQLMARYPDTLIARKCGIEEAQQASQLAQKVLDAGWPNSETGTQQIKELDDWLRADGHRRNPGTTADMVASTLFAAFREQRIHPPNFENNLFHRRGAENLSQPLDITKRGNHE